MIMAWICHYYRNSGRSPPDDYKFEAVGQTILEGMRHDGRKAPDRLSKTVQGVIGPGGVQWMTAGRGIVHSEMPKITDGDLWGFQLWINLPAKDKMVKPR